MKGVVIGIGVDGRRINRVKAINKKLKKCWG